VIRTFKSLLVASLFALCLPSFSASFAQTASLCPEIPDGDQLTVEGVGVVRAASLDSENGITKFINGCFERSGWALEAPVLTLNEDTNELSAQNAKIRAVGARGTVRSVIAKEDNISLETLNLTIDSSFKKSGLPAGTYVINADSGVLQGEDLRLANAVFDRINPSGGIAQRYTTNTAVLKNDTLIVTGLRNATTNVLVNATDATINNGTTTAQNVTGSLGRVSSNSDLTFSAQRAISSGELIVLQNADIKIFGVPIHLDSYTYDPAIPLEIPLVLGFGDGLTIGLSGLRVLNRDEGRLTVIANNLFSSSTAVNPNFTLYFYGLKDGWSYFVGQDVISATYADARASLETDPFNGFTVAANLNSGFRIDKNPITLRASIDARVGYALGTTLSTDLGTFVARAKLEVGYIWQEQTHDVGVIPVVPEANKVYPEISKVQAQPLVRLSPTLNWSKNLVGFSFTAAASFSLTAYPFQTVPDAALVLNANSSFNASYALKFNSQLWGSVSSGISWTQSFGTNVIARYAISPATTLNLALNFTPPIGTVPALGFQGVNVINPKLGLSAAIDLRKVAAGSAQVFNSQILNLGVDIDFYDGITLIDNFGRPFQTPFLSLSPSISYDFIPQKGEFGSSITLYSSSFGFVFGAYITQQNLSATSLISGTGFRFSFSLKLR
jgi:hypothetical protein